MGRSFQPFSGFFFCLHDWRFCGRCNTHETYTGSWFVDDSKVLGHGKDEKGAEGADVNSSGAKCPEVGLRVRSSCEH